MKLTSPKTYRVVRFALEKGVFKQTEARDACGVAFGLANRVTNWLVARGYVAKEPGGYRVIAPAALAQAFSYFRRMEELKTAFFDVGTSPAALKKLFKEHDAVLCLTSALQHYDDYFRDPAIHVYATPALVTALKQLPPGRTRIEVYADDLQEPKDFVKEKGVVVTGRIRTLIDLACSQRAYAADRLVKKTWG